MLPGGEGRPEGGQREDPAGAEQEAREPLAHARQQHAEDRGERPGADRHHGDQFQLREHPVGRLPPELGAQELLSPAPFGVDLGAFHLHADAVAVEGFLEGGDHHAGEPGFELARRVGRFVAERPSLDPCLNRRAMWTSPPTVSTTAAHCAMPIRSA